MNNLFCRSWFCLLTSSERHLQLFLLRLSNNAVVSGCCCFSAQVKLISCNCPSSLLPPRLLVSSVALVVFPCRLLLLLLLLLLFYLFIFYTVVAERNCLLLDSCLDKFYTVLKFGCFVLSGLFPICGVFQFWTSELSSRICDLFIRHSLWTTLALAGFSSRLRPVFPVGQPPLLGF